MGDWGGGSRSAGVGYLGVVWWVYVDTHFIFLDFVAWMIGKILAFYSYGTWK